MILRKLSEGASEADLLDAYPRLTRDDIHAAMRYAADTIGREEVVFIGESESGDRRDWRVLFVADESCDFAVVKALRKVGHDVSVIVEVSPRAEDDGVMALACSEGCVLLAEDTDFGKLADANGIETAGVILIRFPAGARSTVGQAVVEVVSELGDRIASAFMVVEPGRARVSRPPIAE